MTGDKGKEEVWPAQASLEESEQADSGESWRSRKTLLSFVRLSSLPLYTVPHLFDPFVYHWTRRLLPHLDYCK